MVLEDYVGIPYLAGQATVYGTDCLGLIMMHYSVDLKEAYSMQFAEGVKLLESLGFSEDTLGDLVLMSFRPSQSCFHLGIIGSHGGTDYIYHASKPREAVVKDEYESFKQFIVKRFKYNGF